MFMGLLSCLRLSQRTLSMDGDVRSQGHWLRRWIDSLPIKSEKSHTRSMQDVNRDLTNVHLIKCTRKITSSTSLKTSFCLAAAKATVPLAMRVDRKSSRLNSSHLGISYAV